MQQNQSDSIIDLKTEFYTREGLWKLIPNCEYTKSTFNNLNTTTTTATLPSTSLTSTTTTTTTTSISTQQNNNNNTTTFNCLNTQINNDPVKISLLSSSALTNRINNNNNSSDISNNKCEYCKKQCEQLDNNSQSTTATTNICKYCNKSSTINTEFIVFNYCKEVFIYYYNSLKQPSEVKNLIDRRCYKTISATCHDINIDAYIANQHTFLVCCGFSKGEIHVFDSLKKESSLFFNNNKTIDKTKATCIKWIPNSPNLFLIAHSSGNMYLYNINLVNNNPTATATTTNATNNNNSGTINTGSTQINNNSNSTINNNNNNSSNNNNNSQINGANSNANSASNTNTQQSNSQNQQQPIYNLTYLGDGYAVYTNQLSSNPIVKWSITGFNDLNNQIVGINEFSFSPCTKFLACACQDGYLRVFNYKEMTLKSLMKSYFGGLLCVCWSHDGKYIATGGEDDLITIYSFYENRVACRGRGHCSWINSVQFDYWSSSDFSNSSSNNADDNLFVTVNDVDEHGDSDLEDYYYQSNNRAAAAAASKSIKPNLSKQQSLRTKRMSSVSDYEQQISNTSTRNHSNMYYRLGSVGQDNQIAFWDLTEDVLKEKTHNRSRVTSLINNNAVNQTTATAINAAFNTITNISTQLSTSSLTNSDVVPDPRKSPSPPVIPQIEQQQPQQQQSHAQSSNFFFKKNKRYSSLNSNKNHHKSNQLSLLTNKKGNYTISPAGSNDTNVTTSLNSKLSRLNMNQLCPKLDEVPIIEPLICKRISQERLTSIIFKEECFLTASQDGIIYTWARPGKINIPNNMRKTNNNKITNQIDSPLELIQNSTSL